MTSTRLLSMRAACLAALVLAAAPASAAVGFKADNGWTVSFDGFVNAFGVNQLATKAPAGVAADPLMSAEDHNAFRVRTGLLPGLFAFGVTAPKTDGLELKARIGLYPQINNANTRTAFGSQLDLREVYFTVDGAFGQVLLGRALNLYQGKNILTDMSLFGVGVQGAVSSGGTTLGRIGYGYLYAQFGAQLRYTTPALAGVKLAVAVVDPSHVVGPSIAAPTLADPEAVAPVVAVDTRAPGFEAELSWAGKAGTAKLQAWVSGLTQRASFAAGSVVRAGESVTAIGGAAGAGVEVAGVDLLASGFYGEGLGSFLLLDVDSLDGAGKARTTRGFLAQAAYTHGATKVGASYGENRMDETAAEAAAREAGGPRGLRARRSVTGGVYHDLRAHLKLVAEYTHATASWGAGPSQSADVVAVGGFFLW